MSDTPNRRHSISFKERLELAEFLKSVIVTNDEGFSHYKDGWSDPAVAKRMKCSPGNVVGVRKPLYPNFTDKWKLPKKNEEPKTDLLDNLAEQVRVLHKRMSFLEDSVLSRLKYLEEELGITPSDKAK